MENYFLLLELPFDPPEENEEVIKQAIERQRLKWQSEAKNPRKQIQAKEKLAELPEIEQVMLNPSKRKIEAEKARKEQKTFLENLKNEIKVLAAKGYILPDEIDTLANDYPLFNKNQIENIIKDINPSLLEEQDTIPIDDVSFLDSETISQFETYFSNLGYNDMSIYNFLGLPEFSEAEDVILAANEKIKELLEKGEKSNTDEFEQKISGLILSIFPQKQDEYDMYIRGARFLDINNLIKKAIISNKRLSPNVFYALMDIFTQNYGFDTNYACEYILLNCKLNNFEIGQDTIMAIVEIQNQESQVKEVVREVVREVVKEPKVNTSTIINTMMNPIHNLLINNKNKITQINGYLEQYSSKRENSGSGMSDIFSYGIFCGSLISIILDIVSMIFIPAKSIPQIMKYFPLLGIAAAIAMTAVILPAFFKWQKMLKCVKISKYNKDKITNLYNKFINLNFNLLLEDNEKITKTLSSIQNDANKLYEDTAQKYNEYINLSKTYKQEDYYSKVILANFAIQLGVILIMIIF